jgi:hypothetical protein
MTSFRANSVAWLAAAVLLLSACGGGGGGAPPAGGGGANTSIGNFTAVLLDFLTGGTTSTATDINELGLIAGYSDATLGGLRGASWQVDVVAGTVAAPTQLNPLAGAANNYSAAFSVNDTGDVVGESDDAGAFTAVIWAAGSASATALDKGTHADTSAYGINATGQIVGEGGSGGATVALIWGDSTAVPVELGNLAGGTSSSAYGITDGGIVVGEADDGTEVRAVVWTVSVAGIVNGPFDLGQVDPFDTFSAAYSATDLGEIVGESISSTGIAHAVEWVIDPATGDVLSTTDLGSALADSGAYANNEINRIVGYDNAGGAVAVATAWDNRAPTVSADIVASVSASRAFGLNESNLAVGVDGPRAFVAIPQ